MKVFKANVELQKILLDKGFIETTSEKNKLKGKKSFKTSKNARKEVYFDYINILILPSGDFRVEMTEEELKYVILYFNLNSTDFKELVSNGKFNFNEVHKGLHLIKNELDLLNELDRRKSRQKKLNRILETYKNIQLN